MELNGLQNMLEVVSKLYEDGKLNSSEYTILENQIFQMSDYLRAYKKDPTIYWHKFISMEGLDTTLDWSAIGINPDESQE